MNFLKRNWKLLLAFLLLAAAVPVYFLGYRPAKLKYEAEQLLLNMSIQSLRQTIEDDRRYAEVQPLIDPAKETVNESWKALCEKFPTEMREEDQILYILYLEDIFNDAKKKAQEERKEKTDEDDELLIDFNFGSMEYLKVLNNGVLGGVSLVVNYETNYQGLQDLVRFLATDERVTSVRNVRVDYDKETDKATGEMTVLCYVLSDYTDVYEVPEVDAPEKVGKDNIYIMEEEAS